jgi:hypothetical protein
MKLPEAIRLVPSSLDYAESYNKAVDTVAREILMARFTGSSPAGN